MKFIFNKMLNKFQSLYFKGSMVIKGVRGLPAQTRKEIQMFKVIFDNLAERKIRVFEWGSGFSTMYYADYLRKKNIDFEWHSIDNNKFWHEKIKSKIEKKGFLESVSLYVREFQPFWEKEDWDWKNIPPARGIFEPKSKEEKAYIDFPKTLNVKFDVIIIDARFRRRCLQSAKDVLTPDGVVIMHDAQKPQYHIGLDNFQYRKFFETGEWYPFQKILNKVWVGSVDNEKIFRVLNQI